MSKDPFDSLMKLSKLGKKEVKVSIGDVEVVLRSLMAKEEVELFTNIEELKGISFINSNKIETLARSLVEIDGIRFEENNDDVVSKKKQVIEGWGQSIIDLLFTEYAKMISGIESEFEKLTKK